MLLSAALNIDHTRPEPDSTCVPFKRSAGRLLQQQLAPPTQQHQHKNTQHQLQVCTSSHTHTCVPTFVPSKLHFTLHTSPVWPFKTCKHLPVLESQSRTTLSHAPEATCKLQMRRRDLYKQTRVLLNGTHPSSDTTTVHTHNTQFWLCHNCITVYLCAIWAKLHTVHQLLMSHTGLLDFA